MKNEEYLIKYLKTKSYYFDPSLSKENQIRSMMNVVVPINLTDEFYEKQDEYLQDRLSRLNIFDVHDLTFKNNIAIYQGDITLIKADAIVNAGNRQLLGCFVPLHYCIDNSIHSFAGLQVRRDLMEILKGKQVPNATVIVTKGYNLPSKYIFHTVGPVFHGTKQDDIDLANCYINCLKEADKMGLESIVFCSLSTGIFGFPIERACLIAFKAVREYLQTHDSKIKVIFDLFKDNDYRIYEREYQKD